MFSWRPRRRRGKGQPFRQLQGEGSWNCKLNRDSAKKSQSVVAAKLNQVRLEGEPHNPSGLILVAGVVNARDELAKCQHLLLVIDFHDMSIGRETAWALWGVFPMPNLIKIQPGHGRSDVAAGFPACRYKAVAVSKCVQGIITAANHRLMAGFASLAADRTARRHPIVSTFRTNPFSSSSENIYRNKVSAVPYSGVCLLHDYE